MKTCLDEIKCQTGGITDDPLLAMALHSRCQANYQEIENALDSRLVVDKEIWCWRIQLNNRMGGPGAAQVVILVEIRDLWWRSADWACRGSPCPYCWEWGHWVADCLVKKARKLPIVDPRLMNPKFRLKKSSNCHPALLGGNRLAGQPRTGGALANVVVVQNHPGTNDLVLLDSGATDSVTNDVIRPMSCVNAIEVHPCVLHERLGHLSLRLIDRTVRAGAVVDYPAVGKLKLDACCETCATTKATRLPVSLPLCDWDPTRNLLGFGNSFEDEGGGAAGDNLVDRAVCHPREMAGEMP
ncbi:uncharacterized protein VP01_4550g1 [Puccinia sorghi]|uniref:Uncharacterized protein n=1 Tax=Puccinia sorghi TaxID=27349 RepID=A0A0L6UNS0_9BASI|nr:uncharacterized protein VP01_4550g1 [Puccinia sorghi]